MNDRTLFFVYSCNILEIRTLIISNTILESVLTIKYTKNIMIIDSLFENNSLSNFLLKIELDSSKNIVIFIR